MDPQRVLIVESDNSFALSIAAVLHEAGYASAITLSAADAQRELRERRPDLIILRAELPDLSGFAFCGRLRKDKTAQGLPIILVSSDATPEALAQHRSRPASAADGYLSMPFPMEDLLEQARSLLGLSSGGGHLASTPMAAPSLPITPEGPLEGGESVGAGTLDEIEGALEGALGEGLREVAPIQGGSASSTSDPSRGIAGMEAMIPPPPPRPPRLPKRPRRSSLTDEDRSFLDRVFESIADRKTELLAESRNSARRPPVRRELLATPEGKLQILRDELNRRESQVARLSEIWAIRERELTSIDDKLHEKEVEIQGLKMQVDDLLRRLSDARDLFVKKDQEHGAAIDSMLLEKFVNEKELIEVVAAKEKDISLLRRDLHGRDDELVRRNQELDRNREEVARLERLRQEELAEFEGHERHLAAKLARREVEIMGLAAELAQGVDYLLTLDNELTASRETFNRELRLGRSEGVDQQLAHDFAIRDFTDDLRAIEARGEMSAAASAEARSEARAELALLHDQVSSFEEELYEAHLEREGLLVQRDGIHQSLSARLEAADADGKRLSAELAREHEHAVAREGQLSAELAQHIEHIGNLEGELESLRHEKEVRETELLGELRHANDRLEASSGELSLLAQDVQMARERVAQLSQALDDQRARFDEAKEQAEGIAGALHAERDELREQLSHISTELRESLAEKAERERDLQAQIAKTMELAGSLEGELNATREHAREREESLKSELLAAKAAVDRQGEELQVLQAKEDRLGEELRAMQGEGRAAEEAYTAEIAAVNAQLVELSGVLESERRSAADEQARLLAEAEEIKARGEERAAELHAELGRRDQAAKESDERGQQQMDELVRQVELLQQDLGEKTRLLAEEERRVQALSQEKIRREEAATREAAIRAEAAKTLERKLQRQVEAVEERARKAESQLHDGTQKEEALGVQLASHEKTLEALNGRLERAAVERDSLRQELQTQVGARDARVAELQSALSQLNHDRRRVEEEVAARSTRAEGKIKDLEARLTEAVGARERQERELQAASAARARKIQELEQSVELGNAGRARVERELGQRAQAAEAKALELSQKLAQTQRLQRELEGRLQKETGEAAAKMRAEIERRDAQRSQEVARLQQALQEKAKALKVMELELLRVKNRPSSAASLPIRTPIRRPTSPPPPPPPRGDEVQLAELEPLPVEEVPTQVVNLSELNAQQSAAPRKKDDADEDLDAMLNKLEI
jgi:ParB family chromosome partitioning protein